VRGKFGAKRLLLRTTAVHAAADGRTVQQAPAIARTNAAQADVFIMPLEHPERVSHLVLHGGYVRGRLVRDNRAEVEQGEAILKLIEHGWGISGSPFLKSFSTMYIPDANAEQMDSLVELQRLTTSSQNAVAIRRAVDSFDVSHLLAQVSTKTLVMHAANDGVHPVDQGRKLAAGINGSEFVLLDSADHAIVPQESAWERFFWELKHFTS